MEFGIGNKIRPYLCAGGYTTQPTHPKKPTGIHFGTSPPTAALMMATTELHSHLYAAARLHRGYRQEFNHFYYQSSLRRF
jgi:hypothetical protein